VSTPLNKSVLRAFHLLEAFKNKRDGLTLREAADRSRMTVPTAHRFLRTLLSLGALDQRCEGRYVIGSTLTGFAQNNAKNEDAEAILDRHVRQLAATLHETVHVAELVGSMAYYTAKAETQRSLKIVTQVGTSLEAYCTGVGKVLLAHESAEMVSRYLDKGELIALTSHTITDRDGILRELEKVRELGYAIDDQEFEVGLRCLAAPIYLNGRVVAALSCSAPLSRLPDENIPHFLNALKRRSDMIASEFGRKGLTQL
jgi:DNA-binding IclR family transcriptional regulator